MSIADQKPVHSGFSARSAAGDVMEGIDLTGRVALVTGGYSGIGLETVRALAGAGARLIVPVRTPSIAKEALAGIAGEIETAAMDLADLASVSRFAAAVADAHDRLDLLINNAGIMAYPQGRTAQGFEMQFGVNHMGHFALTKALWPLLAATPEARVISLSSAGHKISDIVWDDMHFRMTPYDKWVAYGQAKTANALFANSLSRRLRKSGGLAFAVHPGGILTPLQRHLSNEDMIAMGMRNPDGTPSELVRTSFKTPQQGAATTLWAATSPLLKDRTSVYCEDCDIAEAADPAGPDNPFGGIAPYAASDENAEHLWAVSEALLAQA